MADDTKTIAGLAKTHKCGPQCEFRRGVIPDGVFAECIMYELLSAMNEHATVIAAQTRMLDELTKVVNATMSRLATLEHLSPADTAVIRGAAVSMIKSPEET